MLFEKGGVAKSSLLDRQVTKENAKGKVKVGSF
jgi:hypothetical protein